MDPRERADAALARARARGAFVVTPESAISPMDATSTQQIPRALVEAMDGMGDDPEATMVVPAVPGRGRQRGLFEPVAEPPAIAQEASTQVMAGPPPRRSLERPLSWAPTVQPDPPVTITPYRDGPLLVRGTIELRGPGGIEIPCDRDPIALCRCGGSRIKPFCDGTHKLIGFRAPLEGSR